MSSSSHPPSFDHTNYIKISAQITKFLITYLLTHSMVQSPSWEVNWFAASREIPRILWSPNVHYRTHKPPPPVPILSQPNPDHIPTSHLLEIHPKIIHPSTPRSPHWSLSLRFPYQDPIRPPLLLISETFFSTSHVLPFKSKYITQHPVPCSRNCAARILPSQMLPSFCDYGGNKQCQPSALGF